MSRLAGKRKIATWWPKDHRSRKIILLYHAVDESPWGMSKILFNEQMEWLVKHCEVLSLSNLLMAEPSEKIKVAITFDDGYQCLHSEVAPIFASKNIAGLVYINTGWISHDEHAGIASDAKLGHYPDEKFMTWKEVNDLANAGWEIGSHGVNHLNFTEIPQKTMQFELAQSKRDIELNTSKACEHFSYPWGLHNKQVEATVAATGYRYAAATQHAVLQKNDNLFALPRMNIEKDYTLEDFKNIVQGKWDYLGLLHKTKKFFKRHAKVYG